jgi:hypothetical protein
MIFLVFSMLAFVPRTSNLVLGFYRQFGPICRKETLNETRITEKP